MRIYWGRRTTADQIKQRTESAICNKVAESTQSEKQKDNNSGGEKDSLRKLGDIKYTNICITGIPKRGEQGIEFI